MCLFEVNQIRLVLVRVQWRSLCR